MGIFEGLFFSSQKTVFIKSIIRAIDKKDVNEVQSKYCKL